MASTRIFSVFLFVLCLFLIYSGWDITTEFSYEPLGPRPFPLGTLFLVAFCSVLLFFFAEKIDVDWGNFALWKKLIFLLISFIVFASAFEYLGFILVTIFLVFCIAVIFDAKLIHAIILSVICGVALYYIFDSLLQVTLPLGLIFE